MARRAVTGGGVRPQGAKAIVVALVRVVEAVTGKIGREKADPNVSGTDTGRRIGKTTATCGATGTGRATATCGTTGTRRATAGDRNAGRKPTSRREMESGRVAEAGANGGSWPAGGAAAHAEVLRAEELNEAGAVTRELAAAGFHVPEGLTRAFALYLTRIREWSRHIHLVAAGDLERIGTRHLLESFNVLDCPLSLSGGRLADAGSGAGFPGIPLALLLPDLEVLLIESVRKRARLLARLVAELGLGGRVQVRTERVEDVAAQPEFRERFTVVTMRGLGPLPRVIPWCAPLLGPRGVLVAFKGASFEEELRQALGAIAAAGLELLDIVPLRWGEGRLVLLRRGE